MSSAQILSIDQGTTNTKALLIDSAGRVVGKASSPMTVTCPQPGWIEQDADDLWRSVQEVIAECLSSPECGDVAALAVTNQRESVVVWDRVTGRPAGPCVIWQCRRTAPFCAELRRRGLESAIRAKSGLGLDPLFSASKARWLIESVPDGRKRAAAGQLCMGTVDSWLLWNLTGGATHACDTSNASRTQLMNLSRLEWDAELLEWFGVPGSILPAIRPSSGEFGVTAGKGKLPAGIPIEALIGDSHGALFAHAAFRPGATKATYGTGSSLMRRTPQIVKSRHGLSATVGWSTPVHTEYAIEGNITLTGGAVQWAGEMLGLPDARAVAALAASVSSSEGVYMVPAMAGLGAPYWRDDARGMIAGLTRGSNAAHVARAAVDSVAYQVRDVFDAMAMDTAEQPDVLMADGGASQNDQLMQFQADILGKPVVRNLSTDLSAIGAAWLAGLAAGMWKSVDELDRIPRQEDRFEPKCGGREREQLYRGWRESVARVLHDARAVEAAT